MRLAPLLALALLGAAPPKGSIDHQAVAAINAFSVDLYRQVIAPGDNTVVSPASVSLAIGLAYRGARGRTADELRTMLHFPAGPKAYLPRDAALARALSRSEDGAELHVADAAWVQAGLTLDPGFAADMARHVSDGLRRVDFREQPDAARQTINRWVAAVTRDHIPDLHHPDDVTNRTRFALVNAIYWKGRWGTQFDPDESRPQAFSLADGTARRTPLMHDRSEYQTVRHGPVSAIALPYEGDVSMIVLLPDHLAGLAPLEAGLSAAALERWFHDLDAATPAETILTLPRMHLRWREDLVPALQRLGASTALGDEADFTGIAPEPQPGEPRNAIGLKINRVIHQTTLDVDEEGSAATAATAVEGDVVVSGLRVPKSPPVVFRADHPFLFALRDERTGLILFIGRYVSPPPA